MAVRIPGPESVQGVGPTRDPGLSVNANQFGAQVGGALANAGSTLATIGHTLLAERREHEDRMFLQRYQIERNKEMFQDFQTAQQEHVGSNPVYQPLETKWTTSQGETVKRLRASGFNPSKAALQRAQELDLDLRGKYGIDALTFEHNAAITHLQNTADEDRNAILQTFSQNGNFQDAYSSVNQIIANAAPILGPEQERRFREQSYDQLGRSLLTHLDSFQDEAVGFESEEERQFAITRAEGLVDEAVSRNIVDPAVGEKYKRQWKEQYVKRVAGTMDPADVLRLAEPEAPEFSGSPHGVAASLLRRFEGFREGTYWDVNAHRLGYGTDTITLADGSVRKVRQGDRVSKADAERDLARRIGEFEGTAISQVGAANWSALPPNARAALISVAYNYGSLPKSVVSAIQSGDIVQVASAVESLSANRDRRKMEAAVILGSVDPQSVGERAPAGSVQDSIFTSVPADVRQGIVDDARRRNSVQNRQFIQSAEDYSAYLRAGNQPTGAFQPNEVLSRLGPEQGYQLLTEIQQAESYGQKVSEVKWASPEKLDQMLASELARLQSPEDYRRVSGEVGALQQVVTERNKALMADPARYVAQDESVQRAYSRMNEVASDDQATPQDRRAASRGYADASLAMQDYLGVPREARRILPDNVASEIASQIRFQPEGGQNAAIAMRSMAEQWGEHWPQVFAEIQGDLPGAALVIGAMDRPEQMRAAEQLAEAANLGQKAIEDTLPNDGVKTLKDSVRTNLEDFRRTLVNNVGGERTYQTFHEGVYLLALSYMSQGDAATLAASRAYSDVIGKGYTIKDTYRVPIEYDDWEVERGAHQALLALDDREGLDLPVSGLPDEDTREAYISSVQDSGFWITAPDESGLLLMRPDRHAVTVSGQPLIVPWEDLITQGQAADASVGAPTSALGQPIGRALQLPEIEVILPPQESAGLRPLEAGERRENADGSYSTELIVTVPDADGKWMNVPSLWMGRDGPVELSEDEARDTAMAYERKGRKFPRYQTVDEAVAAAEERSKGGGAGTGPLAN